MKQDIYVRKKYDSEEYCIAIMQEDFKHQKNAPVLTYIWFKRKYQMDSSEIISLIEKYNIIFEDYINPEEFKCIDVKGAGLYFKYEYEAQKFLDEIIIPMEIINKLTNKD